MLSWLDIDSGAALLRAGGFHHKSVMGMLKTHSQQQHTHQTSEPAVNSSFHKYNILAAPFIILAV